MTQETGMTTCGFAEFESPQGHMIQPASFMEVAETRSSFDLEAFQNFETLHRQALLAARGEISQKIREHVSIPIVPLTEEQLSNLEEHLRELKKHHPWMDRGSSIEESDSSPEKSAPERFLSGGSQAHFPPVPPPQSIFDGDTLKYIETLHRETLLASNSELSQTIRECLSIPAIPLSEEQKTALEEHVCELERRHFPKNRKQKRAMSVESTSFYELGSSQQISARRTASGEHMCGFEKRRSLINDEKQYVLSDDSSKIDEKIVVPEMIFTDSVADQVTTEMSQLAEHVERNSLAGLRYRSTDAALLPISQPSTSSTGGTSSSSSPWSSSSDHSLQAELISHRGPGKKFSLISHAAMLN